MTSWLLALGLALFIQSAPLSRNLVFENSTHRHFSTGPNGELTLNKGSGWLRYPDVLLDFDLTLEFRLASEDTNAGVIVRSWTGRGEWPSAGYRISLPSRPDDDGELFTGKRRKVVVVGASKPTILAPGQWQSLKIRAARRRVSITLNGALALEADIESMGGMVMFDAKKGSVSLRNVQISAINEDFVQATLPLAIESDQATVFRNAKRLKDPEPVYEVRPVYTFEAMARQVEGRVEIEAVVLPDGSVGRTRVVKSLDEDLDKSAVAAVRAWRFRPGLLDGKPVPVLVIIDLTFTLR